MNAERATAVREWREGWPVVLSGGLGMSLILIYLASTSVVMKPLQEAFGWSRGEISSIAAFKGTLLIFVAPLLGYAVDRWGSRRIALPGIVIYCAMIAAAGLTGPSIWSWYAVWGFAAFGAVMVSSTVWTAAVASRFDVSRGLAIGVTTIGVGLTSSFVPPIAVWALQHFGWRGVYFTLAGLGFVMAFPAVLFLFFEGGHARQQAKRPTPPPTGLEFRQIVRQFRYWRLVLSMALGATAIGIFQLHLFPMLSDAGLSPMATAGYIALIGPFSVLGRVVGGWLMDRFDARLVAAAAFGLPILTWLLIPTVGRSAVTPVLVVAIVGLATGAESDTMAVLTSRYFGMRGFGRAYAIISAVITAGAGYAGAIGGFLYDRFGDYQLVLQLLAACLIGSMLLILSLGRIRPLEPQTAAA